MAEQTIDLNTAPAEVLVRLPGIGLVLAQRIVAYRDTVHGYDDASQITEVPGIGKRTYRAIADRLAVAPSAEPTPAVFSESSGQAQEEVRQEVQSAVLESSDGAELVVQRGEAEEGGLEPEIKAVPPGESLSEEGLPLQTAAEEELEELTPEPEAAMEAAEELGREAEALPSEEGEKSAPPLEEVAGDPKEPGGGELPPASLASPAVATPRPPWWRRLAWLWTAILGGLLGMVFALIVFAGLNGSLDVGHTRAVLGLESEVSGLETDLASLGTDVEALRGRLDALEGLTTRMEDLESGLRDVRDEAVDISNRADALEEDLEAVSDDLQAASERVNTLERLVKRTDGFFSELQILLTDVFGELEEAVTPTPTTEEK